LYSRGFSGRHGENGEQKQKEKGGNSNRQKVKRERDWKEEKTENKVVNKHEG
jgi:hypothetical protein